MKNTTEDATSTQDLDPQSDSSDYLPQPQPRRLRGFAATAAGTNSTGKGKKEREKEKERTKLRERHRRAITSRMLAGLRQYGNFPLPARADMNDVLAALAREAGWIVDADGTTYRQCLPPSNMVDFILFLSILIIQF